MTSEMQFALIVVAVVIMEKTNRNWIALQDLKYGLPKEDAKVLQEGECHE